MDRQQAPAALGGRVGRRHLAQAQGFAQEVERLHDPAVLVAGGILPDGVVLAHRVRAGHIATPPGDGRGVVSHRAGAQAQQRARTGRAVLHLDGHGLGGIRRHRLFEAHHLVLRHDLHLPRQAARHRLQAEGTQERTIGGHAEAVHERHRNALLRQALQPGLVAAGIAREIAVGPDHHTGIAVRSDLRQRIPGLGKLDAIAKVVERHRHEAHAFAIVDRHARLAFLQDQHAARHHFDLAHAHGLQAGIGDIGRDAERADAAGGVALALAVCRRAVVDRDDRQLVLVADDAGLVQQPVAVLLADLGVGALSLVPATEQRFEDHPVGQSVHLRQDLEATVEQQLGVRVAGLDGLDHAHHPGFLLRAVGVGLGHQVVRVHRIHEEATVAALPQRCDDLVDVEGGPAVGGLVDHAGLPGVVAAGQPCLRNVLEVCAAGQHLAQADIGEPGGIRGLGLARIEAAVGFDHRHVECLQQVDRRLAAIVERYIRRGAGHVGNRRLPGLASLGQRVGRRRQRAQQDGTGRCDDGHGQHRMAAHAGHGATRRILPHVMEKSPD